ncbi:hypothetical protein [uncultured Phycicoccus sp.]|uniref:hypothetical protein n=1 Tax=uncultured Phycicoccus sp. TaxID=661422 RepID=UPI00260FAE5B|nr:hypothetical protein [uncultured Phycicoccus sp.]
MPSTKKAAAADKGLTTRTRFRRLLAGNPNYFGTAPDTGFAVVEKIVASTSYEQLTSVGYNPRARQVYATFDIRKSSGYGGGLCAFGGTEHVRFYGQAGGGWTDLGTAATEVHDIPAGKDCRNRSTHPLSYSVQVPYAPARRWCFVPQLRKVRAILSYGVVPPPNQPDWVPVWGNVLECHVQIDKTTLFSDLFLDDKFTATIDPAILDVIVAQLPPPVPPPIPDLPDLPPLPDPPGPGPLPGPLPPVSLQQRLETYAEGSGRRRKFSVEPARFALPELEEIVASPSFTPAASTALAGLLQPYGIDLGDLVAVLEDTTGNIDYEELVDVGLDVNRHRVDATYAVKKGGGYSGGLCTAGSTEYVAFWADWNDTCEWTFLGTVPVAAYDFGTLPDGRLCYTASLPVDLSEVMDRCTRPKVGKVRAVLSWNTPPSTTDADAVPTYGNRLDTHVLLPVRAGTPGTLTTVGGVKTDFISDVTGLTTPTAKFVDSGADVDALGRPCPFGGLVVVRGPAVAGKRYRLRVVDGAGGTQTLTEKIWVTPAAPGSPGSYVNGTPDGWFDYRPLADNFNQTLGYYRSTGDAKVDIVLEIEGEGDVDHQVIQLDNTWPTVAVDITTPGNCEVASPGTVIEGTVAVHDTYLGSWSVVIDGGPPAFGPHTIETGTTNTPLGGAAWSTATPAQPFPASLAPCGYVARVTAGDRTIVGSTPGGHTSTTDVGFSVV